MKADLTLCIKYRPDAPKRASVPDMPNMFSRPPLSLADVDRTKSTFQEQLSKLEDLRGSISSHSNSETSGTIRVSTEPGLVRSPTLRLQLTNGSCLRTEDSLSMLNLPPLVRSNFGSRRVERLCKKPGRGCGSGHRRKGRVDLPKTLRRDYVRRLLACQATNSRSRKPLISSAGPTRGRCVLRSGR